ncbi:MAG TPA: hypothetical protein EYN51_01210 [Flavobacteriales bacterium]|nr:hypothetical protein [Flavobacteriales bacterium]
MPNNLIALRAEIKKRISGGGITDSGTNSRADIQRTAVQFVMTNLLKFTRVDSGVLAGGWTVRLRGSGGNPRAAANRTRVPSAAQLAPIAKIKGTSTVTISNSVPYARFVNSGTRAQLPALFTELSVLLAARQLRALGLTTKITGTA